ncbi:hypothetical protein SAMN04488061_0529 [Filomicrobium insigne]|uniref:Transposase n=1 Tax=Filomicrobium insigne TaxID=418854 RepID=A0A1H0HJM2_9HYPH|nr:hypothetical protein SAMN04488061_0529 [Filomicrobium insigne]
MASGFCSGRRQMREFRSELDRNEGLEANEKSELETIDFRRRWRVALRVA